MSEVVGICSGIATLEIAKGPLVLLVRTAVKRPLVLPTGWLAVPPFVKSRLLGEVLQAPYPKLMATASGTGLLLQIATSAVTAGIVSAATAASAPNHKL